MTDSLLLTHANRTEALLYLLQRYPAGVTRHQLQTYWYFNSRGKKVCLDWEARTATTEARKGWHIDHITLDGQSAWVLRGKKVDATGQQLLPLPAEMGK